MSSLVATTEAKPPAADSPSRIIYLDHNENAYGPSDKVLAALRDTPFLDNRYPREEYESLRAKIASLHRVKPDNVVLGCGSSEILRLSASVFAGPGRKLIVASPTYPAMARFAGSIGTEVVQVPLNPHYAHDLAAMSERAGDSAGLVYICSPNNPTAALTPRTDIEQFLHKLSPKTTVLIDEAYHHFVDPNETYASFLDKPVDDPRVIVCRTFSKVYGLAGMRVGYAVASTERAGQLLKARPAYPFSGMAIRAASAALDDTRYVSFATKRNADDRQEFLNQINGHMMRALDSDANFVLVNPLRPAGCGPRTSEEKWNPGHASGGYGQIHSRVTRHSRRNEGCLARLGFAASY